MTTPETEVHYHSGAATGVTSCGRAALGWPYRQQNWTSDAAATTCLTCKSTWAHHNATFLAAQEMGTNPDELKGA